MKKKWSMVINIAAVLAIVSCVALLVVRSITSPVIVDGESMMPTLNNLDYGQMNVSSLKKKHVKRFNIVIFEDKSKMILIKRVIGLPGETIHIDPLSGELKVNDRVVEQSFLDEDYVRSTCIASHGVACGKDYEIPEGHYYVLGDNRNHSRDSEHGLGAVPASSIHGVLWYINATCSSIGTKENKDGTTSYVCVGKKSTKLRFF